MQDEKLSPEISHNEDAKLSLDRVDRLDAPSLGGSVQNVEIEPKVGVVTWLGAFDSNYKIGRAHV